MVCKSNSPALALQIAIEMGMGIDQAEFVCIISCGGRERV